PHPPSLHDALPICSGTIVATLDEQPLQEGRGGGDDNGPRAFAWRPDGAGISFLRRAGRDAEEGENVEANEPTTDAPRPDRIHLLTAPFNIANASVIAESEDPIDGVTYSLDGLHVFGEVTKDGETALAHWALGPGATS